MGEEAQQEVKVDEKQMTLAANRLANYLNILLAIDYDIDAVDRIAKSRKIDEFMEAVYNALRRRENLERRLMELSKSDMPVEKTKIDKALIKLRALNPVHIKVLYLYLRERENEIRRWSTYIGSRALAYNRTYGTLRDLLERRGG